MSSSSAGGGGQQQPQHDAHHPHAHGHDDGMGDGTGSAAAAAAARPRRAFVTELQPNDVLMGRGAPICDNTGNIRFLQLVRERCGDYKRAVTRKEKDAIARNIVATIHARQGLFLRRVESPEEEAQLGILQPPTAAVASSSSAAAAGGGSASGGVVMAWTAADEKTVLLKIKQALRDRGLEAKDHPQQQAAAAAAAAATRVPSSSTTTTMQQPLESSEHADDAASSAVDPFGMATAAGLYSPESSNKRARSEISQQQQQQFQYSPRYGPSTAAATSSSSQQQQQQDQMDLMLLNVQQEAAAAHRQRSMSDSGMMNRFDPTNSNLMMQQQQLQQQPQQQFPQANFSQQQQGGPFHPGTVLSQPPQQLHQHLLPPPLKGQGQDSVGTISTTASNTLMLQQRRASLGGLLLSPSGGTGGGDANHFAHLFEGFAPQQQQQHLQLPHYQLHGQQQQRQQPQDWNTSSSTATTPSSASGFNLFPDITTTNTAANFQQQHQLDRLTTNTAANFQQQQQQLEGQSLKLDFRTTAAATGAFPLDANEFSKQQQQQLQQGQQQQQRGREQLPGNIDKKLPAVDKNTATTTTTSTSTNTNETAGEAALRKACQLLDMQQQGQATTTSATTTTSSNDGDNDDDGTMIHLDHIELCLLFVLNSRGLPTWSSTRFQNNNNGDNIILSSSLPLSSSGSNINKPCLLTWNDIGNLLVQQVQTFLSRKTTAFFASNAATATQQQRLVIEGFVASLVTLAMAYSNHPTNLARMTIMLLEKLRLVQQQQQQGLGGGAGDGQLAAAAASNTAAAASQLSSTTASPMPFAGRDSSFARRLSTSMISESERSRTTDQADPAPGTAQEQQQQLPNDISFSTFLIKELGQWAVSLNVADEVGFPVPCSSRDFVASFPQFGQHDVFSTAAVLDASGSRAVLSQVSLLTRLRLIFQNNSSDQMISILRTSPAPPWGTSFEETALIDLSLLQALLGNGFSGLMDLMATSDDLLGILLRHTSITKIDVEKRANQLTSLLHQHIHSRTLNRITHEQGARIVEMIGL